ncbi:MAG: response regulator transcription factor [Chloroflexi bacterium]|nr:response regulator transcription factor [Chloroflexota bacterium]
MAGRVGQGCPRGWRSATLWTMEHDSLEPRLLIAADDTLARTGLAALLAEGGCHILARVASEQLAAALESLSPDALVVDLGWDAGEAIARLYDIDGDLPLLMLANADDEALAAALLAARQFPCFALLPRTSAAEAIMAAVDALLAGLIVLAADFSHLLAATAPSAVEDALNPLTAREREVLNLLVAGLTNRAIAQQLDISPHTIKYHVNAIMSKLNAQSRTEAVVRATQRGLIAL